MTALRPPTALILSHPPPLAPHAGALDLLLCSPLAPAGGSTRGAHSVCSRCVLPPRRQRRRTAGIRAGGGGAHPILRRLHASTHKDDGAHTRRTGVPAFARMAAEDAVVVPVQLDVVLVQVGVQVVGTCPHSTHTAHAIQATCVKQFQMQATDASLNLTSPSHAVARGSSGGFACGGAILEKCCPKRGT